MHETCPPMLKDPGSHIVPGDELSGQAYPAGHIVQALKRNVEV